MGQQTISSVTKNPEASFFFLAGPGFLEEAGPALAAAGFSVAGVEFVAGGVLVLASVVEGAFRLGFSPAESSLLSPLEGSLAGEFRLIGT